jgi:hypothetical protein
MPVSYRKVDNAHCGALQYRSKRIVLQAWSSSCPGSGEEENIFDMLGMIGSCT